jgi:DNA-binding CsgD family transcriptional regulator
MLAGRDEELAALDALFRGSVPGKGTIAVIRGPVASGKTTVLQAFADRAVAAGATYCGAVASRAERGLPLGVLDQLFASHLLPAAIAASAAELIGPRTLTGELGEPEPETISPWLAGVSEGLLRLLVQLAEDGPVVIAVDDMQYADVASLHGLSYFARRAVASPILMVLTECAQALPADRLLRAEILRQGNCHGICLDPLSPASVASLLGAYLDPAAARHLALACHGLTGGSPLLVHALAQDARASADGGPAALVPGAAFRSAVVTCLHRHEPPVVELGQAVAVLAENARPDLLGELLEVSPESAARALAALTASGLLELGHFRHPVARQAVLDHMTADERAALHGRAACTLHRTGATSAILAGHLVAARRIGARWTVPVLREAAAHALADGEADRAIGYLRRAAGECADEQQRATIRFALAAAEWPRDPECATRHLADLVTDARAGRLDHDSLGELAYYLLWAGDTGHAAEILAVLDIGPAGLTSGPAEFPPHHPAFRSPLDFLYPDQGRRARQAARDAAGSAPAALGPAPLGPAPLGPAPDAILAERRLNDPTLVSVTAAMMALIGADLLDRAASWCDMLRQESGASEGSPLHHAVLTAFRAMIEFRQGNLPAAQDHARTALSLMTKKAWGVAIGGPLSVLLLTTTARRHLQDAAEGLRIPVPDAMFGTFYGLLYLYARGEYYLATGRPQTALTDFTDCGNRMILWELDLPGLLPWRIKVAEAHLVTGNHLKARELAKEQLALAGSRFSRTRGIALRTFALTSHPGQRTALLRESAEVLRHTSARLELAYTFTELSQAYLELGEHGRAQWAARQARNLAERCGAQALQATLSTVDTGGRAPGQGVDAKLLAQLSDAEQRVAMLAAYGYTNGQIAHKLYITVSTVEQHLTRVYRKLGVAGRAELPVEFSLPRAEFIS